MYILGAKFAENYTAQSYHYLQCWEDAIGYLEKVWKDHDSLKAKIGGVVVIFPLKLEDALKSLQGSEIVIIHTDVPDKEYIIRNIEEEKSGHLAVPKIVV